MRLAAVTSLDDEDLLEAVRRFLQDGVLTRLEADGAEEFVLSELKSCLSLLDFVRRGLPERLAARAVADAAVADLYSQREPDSAWTALDAWSTGRFLAMERATDGAITTSDKVLAAELRKVFEDRLAAEIATRQT